MTDAEKPAEQKKFCPLCDTEAPADKNTCPRCDVDVVAGNDRFDVKKLQKLNPSKPEIARLKKLKESILILREKYLKLREKKDEKSQKTARQVHKLWKRAERKHRNAIPLSFDEKFKVTEKLSEMVNKKVEVLKKQGKKFGDPHMHSLSKKLKTLNKRLKKFKRIQEKQKAIEEKKAKKAAAAAAGSQPAAETPAS